MRRYDNNMLTNAASLIVCGVLAGVVVAAAAFPAVAMSGLAAKAGADAFDKLPSELTVKRSPQITYLYASDRKTLLTTLYDENRRDVALNDIAPIMRKAMLAAEDQRFYEHNGVDPQGVARAFVANRQSGSVSQGASTISMQYVRLAISYSASTPQEVVDATEDTNVRKLREMRYALAIEKQLTKDQILERYLNIAAFGNGAFGVYAASQVYFSKHPKDLKIEEAAMLAGLVKAPTSFNPADPTNLNAAAERRNWVLDQMINTGAITPAEGATAKQSPIKVTGVRTPNGCVSVRTNHWGFLCDFLYRWWLEQEQFGATPYERENRLKTGGYTIYTSLDVSVQASAKKYVEELVKTGDSRALMLVAVEPGTGKVRMMATNRNYKLDDRSNPANGLSTDPMKRRLKIRGSYPNTTNPLFSGGGDIVGYQGGSTFKLFTLIAALEKGLTLDYQINAISPSPTNFIVEHNSPAACPGTNRYCPVNANPKWMNGVRNMWTGFGRSVNTFFVPLSERIGVENAVDASKRLGIQYRAKGTKESGPNDYERSQDRQLAHGWGAFTLGVSATTPLELANAYATVAAEGKYCEPIPVEEIKDINGNKLDVGNPRCRQAIRTEIARAAGDAARCPVGDRSTTTKCDGGTAQPARGIIGKPIMGKSGTTDGEKTASLIISSKQITVAGILADPDWAQTDVKMKHPQVNPAVINTMRDAMKNKPALDFAPAPQDLAVGKRSGIPNVQCQSVTAAKAALRAAGFDTQVIEEPVASRCPAGTVARTDPSGSATKGSVIALYISSGQATGPGSSGGPGSGGHGPGDGGGGNGPGQERDICRIFPDLCPPRR